MVVVVVKDTHLDLLVTEDLEDLEAAVVQITELVELQLLVKDMLVVIMVHQDLQVQEEVELVL